MTVVSGAVIRLSMPSRLPTPHLMCGLVVGLGVDRIVDAHATVVAPPSHRTRYACAVCGGLLFVSAY